MGKYFFFRIRIHPLTLLAPHLPRTNTNLLLCGFPFPPARDPHHWGCSRHRGPFFFHFSSHVTAKIYSTLQPKCNFHHVGFLRVRGVGKGFFFFFFFLLALGESCLLSWDSGTARSSNTNTPNPQRQLSDLLASFYWEGERANEGRNISKNNSVIEPVCDVAQHKR